MRPGVAADEGFEGGFQIGEGLDAVQIDGGDARGDAARASVVLVVTAERRSIGTPLGEESQPSGGGRGSGGGGERPRGSPVLGGTPARCWAE